MTLTCLRLLREEKLRSLINYLSRSSSLLPEDKGGRVEIMPNELQAIDCWQQTPREDHRLVRVLAEADRARRMVKIAVSIWIGLLALLAGVIFFYQRFIAFLPMQAGRKRLGR
jgi:hypothetical protein